jgi:HlyD family secretion protein
VACGDDATDLVLVGTVERTLVELTAPAFEQITDIPVESGLHVDRGTVCVRFDTTLAEAEVARAEAAVAAARNAAVLAEHDYARMEQLHERRVASEQDLDRAEGERDEKAARLREAEALRAAAQKRLADLTVVSPTTGIVDQLPFDPGERVPAGGVVAVVAEDGAPWIRVWIPERAFALVGPGTPAEIRIDGIDRTLSGHIRDVAREPEFTPHYALTERERVHLVYETRVVVVDAPAALRPGVPAEVTIRLPAAPPVDTE